LDEGGRDLRFATSNALQEICRHASTSTTT
jgi:hypothetical protein